MNRRAWIRWLAFSILNFACVLATVVAWFVLLFNICSNPRVASGATQTTTPYSCHGTIVFITPAEQFQLQWLGPIGLLFMLVSFLSLAWALHVRKTNTI